MGVDGPDSEPPGDRPEQRHQDDSLPVLIPPRSTTDSTKRSTKGDHKPSVPATPTTNNERAATPLLPLLTTPAKGFQCKLTPLQLTAILKPFWNDLLANHVKAVRKSLVENHLKKLDFNASTVRYAPHADATPVHLCAQYGLLAMAKMLVHEFGLAATIQNKVGSTPLHVACKFGQNDIVSWLIDELHVPLDIPDAQNRMALDMARYDTVEKCVLGPLKTQYAQLKHREDELIQENQEATARYDAAQLQFCQISMRLGDTESHVNEVQNQIVEIKKLHSHWLDEWHASNSVLDELALQYANQTQELVNEQQQAQDLLDHEVRVIHDEHEQAQRELYELQILVETTQRELDRRRQLLVDQLGVFDAALHEFSGNKDVQRWALATLLAIARDDRGGESTGQVDRTELLLRPEPVDVVRHVFTAFPMDHELQLEALELLVAIVRLYRSCRTGEWDTFVTAVVDSDVLLLLGDVLARWFREAETVVSSHIIVCVFEALYLCLSLRRNVQRTIAFCLLKSIQFMALHIVQIGSVNVDENTDDTNLNRSLLCYAAFVLLTQVKYGTKKNLLKAGVVRIVFETLRKLSTKSTETASVSDAVETVHYLFATLALLMTTRSTTIDRHGKCREPDRVEDITSDGEFITAGVVVECVRVCVLPHEDFSPTLAAILWAFKLLVNILEHGGDTALRVRRELVENFVNSQDQDPFLVLNQCNNIALAVSNGDSLTGQRIQTVLAGLDLFRVVWIERYDHEGRLVPTRLDVVTSLPTIVSGCVDWLLIPSFENAAGVLVDLASAMNALTCATQNSKNAAILASHDVCIEREILRPILNWTVHFVNDTGASYQEPNLLLVLTRVLKIFLVLTEERYREQLLILRTASASEIATFHRVLHDQSHDTGVCAVLRMFRDVKLDIHQAPRPEWTRLQALCVQIQDLTHCVC